MKMIAPFSRSWREGRFTWFWSFGDLTRVFKKIIPLSTPHNGVRGSGIAFGL